MKESSDLRSFLAKLEQDGQLAYLEKEVDHRYEVAALLYKVALAGGPALFFRKIKGRDIPLVGNVCAPRSRLALALGTSEEELVSSFSTGVKGALPPERISQGACQEVVEKEVDLDRLPIITAHAYDAGPYITSGVVIARHPDTGVANLAIHRIQVIDKKTVTVSMGPTSDLGRYYHAAKDRPLPVAVAIGLHPAFLLVSSAKFPTQVDEYQVIGALMQQPVEVVQAKTVDVEVPARAEIILEGEIPPGYTEKEGPFGEFPGCYSGGSLKPKRTPVIRLKTATCRREPIYQTLICGPHQGYEGSYLQTISKEAAVLAATQAACPAVKAVRIDNSRYLGVIQLAGESHRADVALILSAALSQNEQFKYLVVVDDDVDVDNPTDVFWALTTRVDPTKDLYVFERQPMIGIDPCTDDTCDKLGFDATIPSDKDREGFTRTRIPGLEEIKIEDYLTLTPKSGPWFNLATS